MLDVKSVGSKGLTCKLQGMPSTSPTAGSHLMSVKGQG